MAFLQVCGVELSVQADTLEESHREIGSTETAYDGSIRKTRQATKTDIKFETPPMLYNEAYAWDGFIRGLGEHFPWNGNLYGSKGLGPSASTGASINASEKKHGAAGVAITAGNTLQYDSVFTTAVGGTLIAWYQTTAGGGFTHYILTRDSGGTYNNWTNGASKTAASLTFMNLTSAGHITFSAVGATRYWDDAVVLPFIIPDSWASQIYTFHDSNGFADLPRLYISGDSVSPVTTRTVVGDSTSATFVKCYLNGSLQNNARKLNVDFRQI